jgi:S-DNA-T family DNA segregation ATPase FtsK/SpoIIIE
MTTLTNEQIGTLAKLSTKLASLGCDGEFLPEVSEGPVVTLYRFQPKAATRVSQVENLYKDMAIALGVDTVQVNRIPGESCIGIYVPNKIRKDLLFKDAVTAVWQSKAYIPLCLGIDTMGHLVVEDLASLPHLLIAGTTGGGKSTLLKSILAALEYCKSTDQVRLVLCDPKQVEMKLFEKSPHLLHSIAYSTKEILERMEWLLSDVETRLSTFARSDVVNIEEYNKIRWRLPYIVLVIDELADPLGDIEKDEDRKKTLGKLCEFYLGRIAAKARATGIHIIAATQRPSVKVVEGNIKANFPARISFKLPSGYDSRTVLDVLGAEQLLSQGDMLFLSPNSQAIRRIHAPKAEKEDIKMAIEMAIQKELVK